MSYYYIFFFVQSKIFYNLLNQWIIISIKIIENISKMYNCIILLNKSKDKQNFNTKNYRIQRKKSIVF